MSAVINAPSAAFAAAATVSPVKPHRWTAEEYHRMDEVFAPEARIELIDGEILDMPPIGAPHGFHVSRLTHMLVLAVGNRALVWCQNSISLPPDSEPEPDFALLRPQGLQPTVLPGAADVMLLIEVAQSSLAYDRDIKTRLYARHGIPETWVFDLATSKVLIYRQPEATGYAVSLERGRGDVIAPLELPDAHIDLSAIFA